MRVDGDTGYVVTNHHVASPSQPPRSRPVGASIALVFNSGTPKEQTVAARVVASDPARDLAVLKVSGVKDWPRPIDISQPPEIAETMPVFIFGFPFGQLLATSKGSPAITIAKGSVSSMRLDDEGKLAIVQIDGAINPGNSGGPIVDAKGRLVGVAVMTIQGANIGLAIPPTELTKMLLGRVGATGISAKKLGSGTAEVSVNVQLIDPMNKMRGVAIHYLPGDHAKPLQRNKDGTWPLMPGAQKLDLQIKDQIAQGKINIAMLNANVVALSFQMAYVDGDGKTVYTQPSPYRLDFSKPIPVAGGPSEPRSTNRPADRNKPSGPLKVEGNPADVEVVPGASDKGELVTIRAHDNEVNSICFSSDSKQMFTASADSGEKTARVWEIGSWKLKASGLGGKAHAAISPKADLFALANYGDASVRLHEAATGDVTTELFRGGDSDRPVGIAFSPDGKLLVAGTGSVVRIWEVAARKELAPLQGINASIHSLSFSPNGRLLAIGLADNSVRVWDIAEAKELINLKGHRDCVNCVAFAPNGDMIASASRDHTLMLWDVGQKKAVSTLFGHTDWGNAVAFSLDGKTLASGGKDGTVRLWDVATRKQRAKLVAHLYGYAVHSVAFSPDGKMVAGGSLSCVRLWDLEKVLGSAK